MAESAFEAAGLPVARGEERDRASTVRGAVAARDGADGRAHRHRADRALARLAGLARRWPAICRRAGALRRPGRRVAGRAGAGRAGRRGGLPDHAGGDAAGVRTLVGPLRAGAPGGARSPASEPRASGTVTYDLRPLLRRSSGRRRRAADPLRRADAVPPGARDGPARGGGRALSRMRSGPAGRGRSIARERLVLAEWTRPIRDRGRRSGVRRERPAPRPAACSSAVRIRPDATPVAVRQDQVAVDGPGGQRLASSLGPTRGGV